MLIHWIWFATRSVADHNKAALLSHFQSAEAVYFAQKAEFDRFERITEAGKESLDDKDLSAAQKILDDCTNEKIRVLTYQDAAYPNRLKNIPDPPMVLYYKGQLPDFDSEPVIGVVGTRKASPYGLTTAKRMGYQIASCGGIVVSGCAFGIDAMAMKGALTAGKSVVGVLGCGADIVYPPSNKALFADMERYGCILTEFPPGTPPLGRNFPIRNRIISGLSCGVLVIEAPKGSGALITANRANDQGRDVFAVPSNIDVSTSEGSNELLRNGGILVSSGWDVMSEYVHLFPGKIRQGGHNARLRVYPDELEKAAREAERSPRKVAQKVKKPAPEQTENPEETKKVIDKTQNDAYIDLKQIESSLSPDEKVITGLLAGGERLVDDVIAESGMAPGSVLASLTLLEVKGIVRRLPGRYIALSGGK